MISANAQRMGGGNYRGGGMANGGSASAPLPNNIGSNNNVSRSPSVIQPSNGNNRAVEPQRPNYPTVNGARIYNGTNSNNRLMGSNHPTNPTNSYNSNRGHDYNYRDHSGYGYGRGRYNGHEGYGYRGYGLNVFSPYAVYPFYPTLGLRLGWLPFGYYSFYFDGFPFYYYNSVFYRRTDDNYYEIVSPPLGARVTSIPNNAKIVNVNGNRYYECNGTYYQEESDGNNNVVYHVVGTNGELNQYKSV